MWLTPERNTRWSEFSHCQGMMPWSPLTCHRHGYFFLSIIFSIGAKTSGDVTRWTATQPYVFPLETCQWQAIFHGELGTSAQSFGSFFPKTSLGKSLASPSSISSLTWFTICIAAKLQSPDTNSFLTGKDQTRIQERWPLFQRAPGLRTWLVNLGTRGAGCLCTPGSTGNSKDKTGSRFSFFSQRREKEKNKQKCSI